MGSIATIALTRNGSWGICPINHTIKGTINDLQFEGGPSDDLALPLPTENRIKDQSRPDTYGL